MPVCPPDSISKTRECREQQQRFDGGDANDASKKRNAFAKNAGVAGECDEQAECLACAGRRLEEVLDEPGRGEIRRCLCKAFETDALLRLSDRRLHLLSPVSDCSRRTSRSCDRSGRRAADILEPVVPRKRQSGVRVDDTAGDAALHDEIAVFRGSACHRSSPDADLTKNHPPGAGCLRRLSFKGCAQTVRQSSAACDYGIVFATQEGAS